MTANTVVFSAQFKDEDYFGSRLLFFFGEEAKMGRLRQGAERDVSNFFFTSEGRVAKDHRRLSAAE